MSVPRVPAELPNSPRPIGLGKAGRAGIATPSAAQTRFGLIYDVLRERIFLLDHPPGERLSEDALARGFGVSRTPVRRVLARLEAEGLLRSVQGVGTFVTDMDVDMLAQSYRLRMELAGLTGRLDPVPPSEATLTRLRAVREGLTRLRRIPDARSLARLNIEFTRALGPLTANAPLREAAERIYYLTARFWVGALGALGPADEAAIFEREVTDVLAAAEMGELEAVGLVRRAHIAMSFRRLETGPKAGTSVG